MADLVYGISRWNNANRPRTRHLDTGGGLPLCGDTRGVLSWERDTGEPICARCKERAARWEAYGEDLLRLAQEIGD